MCAPAGTQMMPMGSAIPMGSAVPMGSVMPMRSSWGSARLNGGTVMVRCVFEYPVLPASNACLWIYPNPEMCSWVSEAHERATVRIGTNAIEYFL